MSNKIADCAVILVLHNLVPTIQPSFLFYRVTIVAS